MKNVTTYSEFVNETRVNPKKQFALTTQVQDSIKKMCEGMIHENVMACDMNEYEDQTYEKYIEECASYMKECMNERLEVYRASAKSTAGRY